MLNWAIRYAPIVAFVAAAGPSDILEVGSGSQGLAHYLPGRTITGVDRHFADPLAPNLRAVTALAWELPFDDDAFDLVVSSDMLEYVAPERRAAAVEEMLRVSRRHLLLAFPSGERADETDRRIARHLESHGVPVPRWLEEHFLQPFPTSEEIARAVPPTRAVVTECWPNDNCFLHRAVIIAEMRPWANFLLSRLGRIAVVRRLSFLVNSGPTYREVMVLAKRS